MKPAAGSQIMMSPPDPAHCWPKGLAIASAAIERTGRTVFSGSGEPWSEARRIDGGVQLEWDGVHFQITKDLVLVDSEDPDSMVDLYWNTLVATALELRGVTCLHGFMVEGPGGEGLAVIGVSGAGKTTTGRALLDLGCTLVCDDLLAVDPGKPPYSRPFFRRVPEVGERVALDIGGKAREPQALSEQIPALTRILSLDDRIDGNEITLAGPVASIDHILRSPYVPFEITTDSAKRRLATATSFVGSTEMIIGRPRSRTPEQFATILLDGLRM